MLTLFVASVKLLQQAQDFLIFVLLCGLGSKRKTTFREAGEWRYCKCACRCHPLLISYSPCTQHAGPASLHTFDVQYTQSHVSYFCHFYVSCYKVVIFSCMIPFAGSSEQRALMCTGIQPGCKNGPHFWVPGNH